jgi:hypothetical protein
MQTISPYLFTVPAYVVNKLLGYEELNTAEQFILELVKMAFPVTRQLSVETIKKVIFPDELEALAQIGM